MYLLTGHPFPCSTSYAKRNSIRLASPSPSTTAALVGALGTTTAFIVSLVPMASSGTAPNWFPIAIDYLQSQHIYCMFVVNSALFQFILSALTHKQLGILLENIILFSKIILYSCNVSVEGVSLTFRELSKLVPWKLCIEEIVFLMGISSLNLVCRPKAMLRAHIQSFSLKFSS